MKYFPREVNLEILNYLDSEDECIKLLSKCEIPIKHYTSKYKYTFYDLIFNPPQCRVDKFMVTPSQNLRLLKNVNVKQITFHSFYDEIVTKHDLPKSVKQLSFGTDFNQPVDELPNNITRLILGHSFNQNIDKLPDSITHLELGNEFNQIVCKYPKSLKKILFGEKFNRPIDNLPEDLIYLEVGINFKQSVDLSLYPKIKTILLRNTTQQYKLFKNKTKNCKYVCYYY